VAAVPDSVSEDARTVVLVLAAEEQVDGGQYGEASSMLQSALPQLANEHNRFAVYRLLARINRDLGNDHQLELIIEKALGETQDEALRREAESWRD
jgi:Arc/MetJ-type ribon-helix-helix transcriptional regulator